MGVSRLYLKGSLHLSPHPPFPGGKDNNLDDAKVSWGMECQEKQAQIQLLAQTLSSTVSSYPSVTLWLHQNSHIATDQEAAGPHHYQGLYHQSPSIHLPWQHPALPKGVKQLLLCFGLPGFSEQQTANQTYLLCEGFNLLFLY